MGVFSDGSLPSGYREQPKVCNIFLSTNWCMKAWPIVGDAILKQLELLYVRMIAEQIVFIIPL